MNFFFIAGRFLSFFLPFSSVTYLDEILQDQVTRITEEKTLQIQYESVMRDNQLLKTKVDDLEGKLQDAIEVNSKLKETNSNRVSEVQSKLQREKELQVQVKFLSLSCF